MSTLVDALLLQKNWRGTASALAEAAQILLSQSGEVGIEAIGRNGVIAYRAHRILSNPEGKTFVWRHLAELCCARILVKHGWSRKQLADWLPHQTANGLLAAIGSPADPIGAESHVTRQQLLERSEIALRLLSIGVVDVYRQVREGHVVLHGGTLPSSMKTALFRLSEICVASGGEDPFGSTHDVLKWCTRPVGSKDWPWPGFDDPGFAYAGIRLIDPDSRLPSEEAIELSRSTVSELDLREQMAFAELRATAERFVGAGASTYSVLRRFIAEHPITSAEEIMAFERKNNLQLADPFLQNCYESIQPHHLVGGTLCRCASCHAPLRPGRLANTAACGLRQCAAYEKMVDPQSAAIEKKPTTRIARPHILLYWIAPAIDELAIASRAAKLGVEHALYPMFDACDVSLESGTVLGIDVKSYSSPFVLAHALNRGIGNLCLFSKRIVAINDQCLAGFPLYLEILRREYRGDLALSFISVSDLLKRIGASV